MASIKENFRKAAKLRGYNLNDAASYFGISASNLTHTLSRESPRALDMLEKIRHAPIKEDSRMHSSRDDINSGQVTSYKLPEVGRLLQQGAHKMRVFKHLNETDFIAHVQYNGVGPWYRKVMTIKPHNRLNWTGLWEAPKRIGGKR